MNRTRIEWTDYSWNPITGCLHDCWYCYAKKLFTRFHRSFEPTFHPERLDEPFHLDMRNKRTRHIRVFVCSVADLFAPWTKPEWRDRVLEVVMNPGLRFIDFQLLTKNPENVPDSIMETEFPENVWIGATITGRNDQHLDTYMKYINCGVRFLSFEPLLGEVNCTLENIDWIIIGKLTGSRKIPLQKEWVQSLINQARALKVPVFIKNNVGWPERLQQFPQEATSRG